MKAYRYFLLSGLIMIFDQITKILVVKFIPLHTSAWSFLGDFFRLIHVRNLGMVFSFGSTFSPGLKLITSIILPMLMLIALGLYIVRSKELTSIQRWILAAIFGGGLGNQIDRIFRPDGVVDFLDFKFYGLFGLERWPTFNIADSALVVSSILLILLHLIDTIRFKRGSRHIAALAASDNELNELTDKPADNVINFPTKE
ncbi:MAG: signal peptidase II [Spirochaeta sp. LUC14_002_19_P3]|nr:MAG: signal peptidase II [Spirochaeta sp. LUC14_002_19_P3]